MDLLGRLDASDAGFRASALGGAMCVDGMAGDWGGVLEARLSALRAVEGGVGEAGLLEVRGGENVHRVVKYDRRQEGRSSLPRLSAESMAHV